MIMDIETLKFPIGLYVPNKNPNTTLLKKWIFEIETFPNKVEKLISETSAEALNWRYRPEGWSVKQVVHHCADSHMNSLIRFKLALTEQLPKIRPYYEDRWAKLVDGCDEDVSVSIDLLKALHKKWAILLKSLTKNELNKEFMHPEHGQVFNLAETIGNYVWHGNHHLEHIKLGIASQGKYNK